MIDSVAWDGGMRSVVVQTWGGKGCALNTVLWILCFEYCALNTEWKSETRDILASQRSLRILHQMQSSSVSNCSKRLSNRCTVVQVGVRPSSGRPESGRWRRWLATCWATVLYMNDMRTSPAAGESTPNAQGTREATSCLPAGTWYLVPVVYYTPTTRSSRYQVARTSTLGVRI